MSLKQKEKKRKSWYKRKKERGLRTQFGGRVLTYHAIDLGFNPKQNKTKQKDFPTCFYRTLNIISSKSLYLYVYLIRLKSETVTITYIKIS